MVPWLANTAALLLTGTLLTRNSMKATHHNMQDLCGRADAGRALPSYSALRVSGTSWEGQSLAAGEGQAAKRVLVAFTGSIEEGL